MPTQKEVPSVSDTFRSQIPQEEVLGDLVRLESVLREFAISMLQENRVQVLSDSDAMRKVASNYRYDLARFENFYGDDGSDDVVRAALLLKWVICHRPLFTTAGRQGSEMHHWLNEAYAIQVAFCFLRIPVGTQLFSSEGLEALIGFSYSMKYGHLDDHMVIAALRLFSELSSVNTNKLPDKPVDDPQWFRRPPGLKWFLDYLEKLRKIST